MIVHVSNREAMEEIRRAQQRGLAIHGETCPQYLVLTEQDMDRAGMEGAKSPAGRVCSRGCSRSSHPTIAPTATRMKQANLPQEADRVSLCPGRHSRHRQAYADPVL